MLLQSLWFRLTFFFFFLLWKKTSHFLPFLFRQGGCRPKFVLRPLYCWFTRNWNTRKPTSKCAPSRWRSRLRHCATSRKVAGSIPDGVIGIFHWHNSSGRTVALGSTQPLTEMSTRNISWCIKSARCVGLTTLPPSCADGLEIWEPQPAGTLTVCTWLYRDFFTFQMCSLMLLGFLPYASFNNKLKLVHSLYCIFTHKHYVTIKPISVELYLIHEPQKTSPSH